MHLEDRFRHFRAQALVAVLVTFAGGARVAFAQEEQVSSGGPVSAQRSSGAGAFSNWNTTARTDTQRAAVHASGGYDGASKGATFDTGAEARIMDRLAIRAAGSSSPASQGLGLRFEGKVDALRQESQGVDLAVAGGYESRGFNEVPSLAATVALGRSVGKLQLLANVGYARGLQDAEQYGSAGVAGIYQVASQVQLGLDSRFRIDLERDDDEPLGEREWELLAGPTLSVSAGSFAVIAGGGMAANRLRLEPGMNLGVLGYLGLGAAF
jgi:hypothetical protein